MRKVTAILFALLITVSATAAPNSDSGFRDIGPIQRIIRIIKRLLPVISPNDNSEIQPTTPVPSTTPVP